MTKNSDGSITDLNANFKNGTPGVAISVSHSPQVATRLPPRLERETSSWRILVVLCSTSVALELSRQVCSYAMKYFNDSKFPMPSTFLVFISECLKLLIFTCKMFISGNLCASGTSISFAYLIPSTLYALNNNIYFLALHFTTPPVWNILMQSRVISTALVYRFYFKKTFTKSKWLALLVLTGAILILQFTGSDSIIVSGAVSWNLIIALGLAAVASVFSAVGPVFTEYLLKHDKRSFDDKQFQIYMFGSLVTGSFFILDRYSQSGADSGQLVQITGDTHLLTGLVVAWVSCTVISGIVVAFIIKKLDNIVKLYTQAVSSALTAIVCVFLFPLAFHFDISFIVSFILTIVAIYLYEAKDPFCRQSELETL